MSRTFNLFISHSWAYSNAYANLLGLLDAAPRFNYRDYSVPKNDPIHTTGTDRELAEAIQRQMSPCHVVLIMAGVYVNYSKWINKEIRIAKNNFLNSKPILAIRPWAQTNISSVVSDAADAIVFWNTSSIVTKIRELAI